MFYSFIEYRFVSTFSLSVFNLELGLALELGLELELELRLELAEIRFRLNVFRESVVNPSFSGAKQLRQ